MSISMGSSPSEMNSSGMELIHALRCSSSLKSSSGSGTVAASGGLEVSMRISSLLEELLDRCPLVLPALMVAEGTTKRMMGPHTYISLGYGEVSSDGKALSDWLPSSSCFRFYVVFDCSSGVRSRSAHSARS